MLVLALEQSASLCSAVIMRNGVIAAESHWETAGLRNQQIFDVLPALFKTACCEPSDVDLFALGTGPGAFSALRIATAALAGLAGPGSKPVIGVPSTEALAHELWHSHHLSPLLIVGDARRDRYWRALYEGADGTVRCTLPPALCGAAELAPLLPAGGLVATPTWSRLASGLPALLPSDICLLTEDSVPQAATIARLAEDRYSLGPPWDPAIPLYLSPATHVAPRIPS